MSKILKGIGKIFKKVVKVAKIVIPIALAAAAVVFTGGAALGILPAFSTVVGGLVGGLGLSAGLAGALTGSIVTAGFGAAAGLVTGGVKGAQKGALMGAVTGGLLGAASPSFFGMGPTPAGASAVMPSGIEQGFQSAGPGLDTVANGVLPNGGLGTVAAGAAPAVGVAAPAVAPAAAGAAAGGNGLLSGFLSNPMNTMMAGNVLTGLFTPSESSEAARLRERDGDRLFSDIYSSGSGTPGSPGYGDPRVAVRPVRRFRFNPESLQVEEVENAR